MLMVKLLKLVSGDDVVADVTISGDEVILKNPLQVILTREGVAALPFMPLMKGDTLKINKSHCLIIADPNDDCVNHYNEKFGGVVRPPGIQLVQ